MVRSDYIAFLAVVLSLIVPLGLEFYRRARPLSVRVVSAEVVDKSGDSVYYCLKLAAYNNASIPKTIFKLLCQDAKGFQLKEVCFSAAIQQGIAVFHPRPDGTTKRLRLDEIIALPLDVDPLRSKTFYIGIEVSPTNPQKTRSSKKPLRPTFYLEAQDMRGERVARTNWKCNYPLEG
ncbi:MAG: hypothetical protein FWH42_03430 [Dehalococcoidia bacterium]|nr:hypothetical protein [Dehalococcoidia bacterium]